MPPLEDHSARPGAYSVSVRPSRDSTRTFSNYIYYCFRNSSDRVRRAFGRWAGREPRGARTLLSRSHLRQGPPDLGQGWTPGRSGRPSYDMFASCSIIDLPRALSHGKGREKTLPQVQIAYRYVTISVVCRIRKFNPFNTLSGL